jgi:4-carboxymuconolactone decarboxylase
MSREPSAAEKMIGDFAPKLVDLTDRVLFGEVWERQELSKRDRSLVTVAALIALNRPEQLRFPLDKALENGLKKEELIEVITHLAFYSGWPNAMSAIMIAKEVFSKAGRSTAKLRLRGGQTRLRDQTNQTRLS